MPIRRGLEEAPAEGIDANVRGVDCIAQIIDADERRNDPASEAQVGETRAQIRHRIGLGGDAVGVVDEEAADIEHVYRPVKTRRMPVCELGAQQIVRNTRDGMPRKVVVVVIQETVELEVRVGVGERETQIVDRFARERELGAATRGLTGIREEIPAGLRRELERDEFVIDVHCEHGYLVAVAVPDQAANTDFEVLGRLRIDAGIETAGAAGVRELGRRRCLE